MTGRTKLALGAIAACAVGVGAAAPWSGARQTITPEFIGHTLAFKGGGVDGLAHVGHRRGGRSAAVRVSLHGLRPGSTYEVVAIRRPCARLDRDAAPPARATLWKATLRTGTGADDAFAALRVPVEPDAAIGAGGAGLYLVAPDGGRKLESCGRGLRGSR